MSELFDIIGIVWTEGIIRPMINSLVLLYGVAFNNFGISILIFTMIARGVMVPLTIKQSRQMRAMSVLQPRLKELQERYSKDRQRLSQETMKIYKEQGVNPLGCLGPMFVQLPIWIGLYQAILQTVPSQPEALIDLSGRLYRQLPQVHEAVPLNSAFLWLDLGKPDPSPFILPVLVGASMYVMQKMTTMPSADPRQQSTNRMMLWMMPLMFGFFTLNFPSGLALYWIVSNIVGIVIQGFITGWAPLVTVIPLRRAQEPAPATALVPTTEETEEHDTTDRDDGQDNRRGNRNRPKGTRRRSRQGRNRRR